MTADEKLELLAKHVLKLIDRVDRLLDREHPSTPEGRPLIRASEVAKRLGVQDSTVYALAAKGTIQCVRLSRGKNRSLIRFRQDDVDNFILENTVPEDT